MWAVEKKTAELAKEGSLDLQEAFSELGLTMQSFQILNSERTNFPERSISTHSNLDLEA
jgi:membrane protease subunit (stomatin/prohibitin family)